MYLEYFGLSELPFAITPDPSFVFLSPRHRDALAHLVYGVGQGGSGGFVQLTGEVGTGKTTLCRCLLEQVPEGTHIALVLNPLMRPVELLAAICEELGLDTYGIEDSSKALVDLLNRHLLALHHAGERAVVVIDEAQNLSPEALEQVRLLTNLETSKQKLLQIILLGQPELRELLRRRSLRQLAQRITARFHLTPLGPEETARYVSHRLQVAGAQHNPFRAGAMKALFQRSHGVPRLINIIADRALVAAFARERTYIDARLVHAAADEVQLGEPGVERRWFPGRWVAAVAVIAVLAFAVGWSLPGWWPTGADDTVDPTGNAGSGEEAATVMTDTVPDEPAVVQATEPEPPVVETPPPEDPLDPAWLTRQDLSAWRGLAATWGRPGESGLIETACRGTGGLGFACLRDTGNWQRIQRLGLPVVLQLQGSDGTLLLLRGLDGDQVLVGPAGDERRIPRARLEERWLGTYFVAWPQAPNWPREVVRGDSGAAVETILQLAARTDRPYRGEPAFGQAFEDWLKDFQVRHGLDADGIVGPKTLLYLMSFSIEQPRLVTGGPADA